MPTSIEGITVEVKPLLKRETLVMHMVPNGNNPYDRDNPHRSL